MIRVRLFATLNSPNPMSDVGEGGSTSPTPRPLSPPCLEPCRSADQVPVSRMCQENHGYETAIVNEAVPFVCVRRCHL